MDWKEGRDGKKTQIFFMQASDPVFFLFIYFQSLFREHIK